MIYTHKQAKSMPSSVVMNHHVSFPEGLVMSGEEFLQLLSAWKIHKQRYTSKPIKYQSTRPEFSSRRIDWNGEILNMGKKTYADYLRAAGIKHDPQDTASL